MYIVLVSIIVFVCVLLVLVVLAQNSKGGGLSGQFGGAGASQLMGVKRTGDLLEKLTWGFAIAIIALTLGSHMVLDNSDISATNRSVNQQRAADAAKQAPAVAPAAPGTAIPEGNNAAQPQTQTNEKPAVATPEADPLQQAADKEVK